MDIGFVGLGAMGREMARNLLKAGHRVAAYNRSPAPAEALAREGASIARTPAEAARRELVVTMVADDGALAAVTDGPDGILAGLPAGATHVCM
ncbi:MAG: NAD(P)-binding domain-containing protein, partial [Rhodospirillaceae bacterium]|nr:NAD(P)-binding domain-containing protein [Rhodospirillaceae bacterium]